jgi:3-hydroxybutyryl-CoA dehydrogenase
MAFASCDSMEAEKSEDLSVVAAQGVREVKTVGVVGARAMGREIALAAAVAGFRVVIEDVSPELLDDAVAYIRRAIDGAVARRELQAAKAETILAGVATSRSVEDACRVADFLIEAGPEELELKLEIFTLFDKFALPGAILASTTSSISIADLTDITFRGENCVGMRFLDSEGAYSRVRIRRGPETSEATVAACAKVARRMGMESGVVSEAGPKKSR